MNQTKMLAVIEARGKQYLVAPGDKIKINGFIEGEKDKVIFDRVLLFIDGEKIEVGEPELKNVKVEGVIQKKGKTKKVIVFKHERRKRHNVKKGYRQNYTEVKILKIESA